VLQDVLIISQFIRANGEVLPQHVTGLCYKAHLRLQRVVKQAQLAGLNILWSLKIDKNVAFIKAYFKDEININVSRNLQSS